MKLVLRPLTNCILHLLLLVQIQIKIELYLLSMGLSTYTKLQLIHSHAQEKMIDNRFPRNESSLRSSIKCKQVASINVKMVDNIIITARFLWTKQSEAWTENCLRGYNNRKILFAVLYSPLFWILYVPMDSASGIIEISECYIKKLNCGHTLQSYDTVVL